MISSRFQRTALIIGENKINMLKNSKVTVFGLGGVGSAAVEGIVRSAIGEITIVDHDKVCETNCNRQLIALTDTIGMFKTDVVNKRMLSINPNVKINPYNIFCNGDNIAEIIQSSDFVIDAIDTVSSKIAIIEFCKENNIPFISCMGVGNRFDPSLLRIIELEKTYNCPLAKVMRRELRKRKLNKNVNVIFSEEKPTNPEFIEFSCHSKCVCPDRSLKYNCLSKRKIPGSSAFVPPAAGFLASSFAIRKLIGII